jgi:hypothetical protein
LEGAASIDGRTLSAKGVGSEELDRGQVLETSQGKAEMLLTPGVFLRMGDDSAVRMISPGLTDTRVELVRGHALVEATDVLKGNNIQIVDAGSVTRLLKNGLYAFNAAPAKVAVFDGKAEVERDDRTVTVKGGHELDLSSGSRARKFDKKVAEREDPLYLWSSVRSEYLAEASLASARTYVVEPDLWMGAGWYWNPWFSAYSFIPGDGIFYSPFGFGYYSPWFAYRAPVFYRPWHSYRGGHAFAGAPRPGARASSPRVMTPPRPAVPAFRAPSMHR